jgi:multidrug efflux pump subunit AcrB
VLLPVTVSASIWLIIGKLGRHSVVTAIVGGMLFSTVVNLFFITVL